MIIDKYEFQNYLYDNKERLNIHIHPNGIVSPCIIDWRTKLSDRFNELKSMSTLQNESLTVRVLQHDKELQLLAKMANKVFSWLIFS